MADTPLTAEELALLRENVFTVWKPMFDKVRAELLDGRVTIAALTERAERAEAHVAGLKDIIELVEAANEDLAARVAELEAALSARDVAKALGEKG